MNDRRPVVIEAGNFTLDESGISINGWHVDAGNVTNKRAAVVIAVRDYLIEKLSAEPDVPSLDGEVVRPVDPLAECEAERETRRLIEAIRGDA